MGLRLPSLLMFLAIALLLCLSGMDVVSAKKKSSKKAPAKKSQAKKKSNGRKTGERMCIRRVCSSKHEHENKVLLV